MTKTVHPYHWVIVGGERFCEGRGDLVVLLLLPLLWGVKGGREENNPTVDVDGLYSVQMPNCEKKSRRTVERIPECCRPDPGLGLDQLSVNKSSCEHPLASPFKILAILQVNIVNGFTKFNLILY